MFNTGVSLKFETAVIKNRSLPLHPHEAHEATLLNFPFFKFFGGYKKHEAKKEIFFKHKDALS